MDCDWLSERTSTFSLVYRFFSMLLVRWVPHRNHVPNNKHDIILHGCYCICEFFRARMFSAFRNMRFGLISVWNETQVKVFVNETSIYDASRHSTDIWDRERWKQTDLFIFPLKLISSVLSWMAAYDFRKTMIAFYFPYQWNDLLPQIAHIKLVIVSAM